MITYLKNYQIIAEQESTNYKQNKADLQEIEPK